MNITFAKDVAERAVKTFIQALAAAWISNQSSITSFDWRTASLLALTAAITSVFTSFVSAGVTQNSTASVITGAAPENAVKTPETPVASTTTDSTVESPNLYGNADEDTPTID